MRMKPIIYDKETRVWLNQYLEELRGLGLVELCQDSEWAASTVLVKG